MRRHEPVMAYLGGSFVVPFLWVEPFVPGWLGWWAALAYFLAHMAVEVIDSSLFFAAHSLAQARHGLEGHQKGT